MLNFFYRVYFNGLKEDQSLSEKMDILRSSYFYYIDCLYITTTTELSFKNYGTFISKEPSLSGFFHSFEEMFKQDVAIRRRLPRYGAIILHENKRHALIVKGIGCEKWNFPSGKMESCDENGLACASREVSEEIGQDFRFSGRPLVVKGSSHETSLFICYGIDFNTRFKPSVRGEIEFIA